MTHNFFITFLASAFFFFFKMFTVCLPLGVTTDDPCFLLCSGESSPFIFLQARAGIWSGYPKWLVPLCHDGMWNYGLSCITDQGEVTGHWERHPAAETFDQLDTLSLSGKMFYHGNNIFLNACKSLECNRKTALFVNAANLILYF